MRDGRNGKIRSHECSIGRTLRFRCSSVCFKAGFALTLHPWDLSMELMQTSFVSMGGFECHRRCSTHKRVSPFEFRDIKVALFHWYWGEILSDIPGVLGLGYEAIGCIGEGV